MRLLPRASSAVLALPLAACVSAAPLELAHDHPASPNATSGLIGTPAAFDAYKTPTEFEARAAADASAPPTDHRGHGGMQHGSAPQPGGRTR